MNAFGSYSLPWAPRHLPALLWLTVFLENSIVRKSLFVCFKSYVISSFLRIFEVLPSKWTLRISLAPQIQSLFFLCPTLLIAGHCPSFLTPHHQRNVAAVYGRILVKVWRSKRVVTLHSEKWAKIIYSHSFWMFLGHPTVSHWLFFSLKPEPCSWFATAFSLCLSLFFRILLSIFSSLPSRVPKSYLSSCRLSLPSLALFFKNSDKIRKT